ASVRRPARHGIHVIEHRPVGAERAWSRRVVPASYTIAYAPDAGVTRAVVAGLKAAYRNAVLTGYTDQHYGDGGGSLWPDSRHFVKRAAWYLLKVVAWGELPYLALEDMVQRYAYRLGRRLDRMSPRVRGRFAP